MDGKDFVEKFQCPGCVAGSDTSCGRFIPDTDSGGVCRGHVVGTIINGRHIALGLPKGFCITGWDTQDNPKEPFRQRNQMNLRFWTKGTSPDWDRLNIPVWATEKEGFLFVRTYQPRIDMTSVDIVEGGTLALCPNAINVGEFEGEID